MPLLSGFDIHRRQRDLRWDLPELLLLLDRHSELRILFWTSDGRVLLGQDWSNQLYDPANNRCWCSHVCMALRKDNRGIRDHSHFLPVRCVSLYLCCVV